MNTKPKWIRIAQLGAVLLCAAAIKLYYSTASVNDLFWILAPTTTLVEFVTRESFTFESYAGYMSSDHSFLIAASCSGVNFFITAFLMLSLRQAWRCRPQNMRWRFIPFALMIAYLTTIAANTVRISTTMQLRRIDPEVIWVNPDQLHRFEGIFVYFGFLLLLYFASEKLRSDNAPTPRGSSGLLRRSMLPLLVYYATTLGIPLANGAYRQGTDFWVHSVFVLLIPLILVLVLAAFGVFHGQKVTRLRLS
jgi:exosortase K